MLQPIERGQMAYRQMRGLPPLFHCRLKHQGRTLAVLSGDTMQEAHDRAERLVDVLIPDRQGVAIEPA